MQGNPFDQYDANDGPRIVAPGNQGKVVRQQQEIVGGAMDNKFTAATLPAKVREANAQATIAEGNVGNSKIDNTMKLRGAFEGQPSVKEYRSAIPQMVTGLKTANNPAGDNALIYAYAKVMDPLSGVKEGEAAGVANSDTVFGRAYAYAQKQLDGKGTFSPEARNGLRREMLNKAGALNRAYVSERERYSEDAKAFGLDPARVVGKHSGASFLPEIKAYAKSMSRPDPEGSSALDKAVRSGLPYEQANQIALGKGAPPLDRTEYERALTHHRANPEYRGSYGAATIKGYDESLLGQAMSGVNEGVASVLGAPVDLVTGALNLGAKGANAVANTDIPTIDNPTLGSQSIKDGMAGWATYAPTDDPQQQFARRVAQSVGAAAVPAPFAGSLRGAGGQLLAGLGGGIGGATAQQLFPGNPYAEMAGEVMGGGGTGLGLAGLRRRGAQRSIEAAVPTVPELREQAGNLYRQAESRGVVADGTMTQQLSDNFRTALADEGRISPTGRISEVYPKAREAAQLIDDYAGQPMNPTQMQTVRKVASDGLSSADATERRLGGILTDTFDDWANPLAPELREARDVASRYLTAEQLTRARELAGSKASQFTGSGFENALRTEYRALDRGAIRGSKHFSDDVTDAIETVSRGTPGSNFARNLGKLAPTGVVSFGLGSGLPAIAAGSMGGPLAAGVVGGGMSALGIGGRSVATGMGIRNADIAELVARNGGRLPQADYMTPEVQRALAMLTGAEGAKYLQPGDDQPAVDQQGYADPDPLARRKGQGAFPGLAPRR